MNTVATPDWPKPASTRSPLTGGEIGHDPMLEAMARNLADTLDCPVAIIRLRTQSGAWHNGYFGTSGRGRLLEHSIAMVCQHQGGPLIADDAASHSLLSGHPLVTNPPQVRSFAGIALFEHDEHGDKGAMIGTVCVMSADALTFSPGTQKTLENTRLMLEMLHKQRAQAEKLESEKDELGTNLAHTKRLQRQHRQAERAASFGSWHISLADQHTHLSEGVYAIFEIPIGQEISIEGGIGHFAPEHQGLVSNALTRAVETGEGWDIEAGFVGAKGTRKRVRLIGEVELKDGQPDSLVGVFHDITQCHALEQELQRRVKTDEVTGLANRASFNEVLAHRMEATRKGETPLCVVMIHLDGFHQINETAGHSAGDDLLRRAAAILGGAWLSPSFIARLKGANFVLLMGDNRQIDNLPAILTRLSSELAAPMVFGGDVLRPGASIGASIMRKGGDCDPHDLLEAADGAIQEAKNQRQSTDGGSFVIAPPASCSNCCADCLQESHAQRAAG